MCVCVCRCVHVCKACGYIFVYYFIYNTFLLYTYITVQIIYRQFAHRVSCFVNKIITFNYLFFIDMTILVLYNIPSISLHSYPHMYINIAYNAININNNKKIQIKYFLKLVDHLHNYWTGSLRLIV